MGRAKRRACEAAVFKSRDRHVSLHHSCDVADMLAGEHTTAGGRGRYTEKTPFPLPLPLPFLLLPPAPQHPSPFLPASPPLALSHLMKLLPVIYRREPRIRQEPQRLWLRRPSRSLPLPSSVIVLAYFASPAPPQHLSHDTRLEHLGWRPRPNYTCDSPVLAGGLLR